MLKVFKYQVEINDIIEVEMPIDANPLHFDMQNGILCLWALVDPAKPLCKFKFRMAGTGHEIDTCGAYINTLILQDGRLVFHFFFA